MINLENYAECDKKQEEGSPLWIDDGAFFVKRLHTPESTKEIEALKRSMYGFANKDEDYNEIMAHWLAEHGVTKWEGVYANDEELPFTRQNARAIFLNPAYKNSLNTMLLNHAMDYTKYLMDEVNEDIDAVKKN